MFSYVQIKISCLAYSYQTILGSVLDCSEQRRRKRNGGWTYHKFNNKKMYNFTKKVGGGLRLPPLLPGPDAFDEISLDI